MKALGVRSTKDTLDWVVLAGSRSSADCVAGERVSMPDDERGDQLLWVWREVGEILSRVGGVDAAGVMAVEPGGRRVDPKRAEVDGVVQAALAQAGVPQYRLVNASLRSAFSAKTKAELENVVGGFPVVIDAAKSRRAPRIAALAVLE